MHIHFMMGPASSSLVLFGTGIAALCCVPWGPQGMENSQWDVKLTIIPLWEMIKVCLLERCQSDSLHKWFILFTADWTRTESFKFWCSEKIIRYLEDDKQTKVNQQIVCEIQFMSPTQLINWSFWTEPQGLQIYHLIKANHPTWHLIPW